MALMRRCRRLPVDAATAAAAKLHGGHLCSKTKNPPPRRVPSCPILRQISPPVPQPPRAPVLDHSFVLVVRYVPQSGRSGFALIASTTGVSLCRLQEMEDDPSHTHLSTKPLSPLSVRSIFVSPVGVNNASRGRIELRIPHGAQGTAKRRRGGNNNRRHPLPRARAFRASTTTIHLVGCPRRSPPCVCTPAWRAAVALLPPCLIPSAHRRCLCRAPKYRSR